MFFCLDTKEPKNQGFIKIVKIRIIFPKRNELPREIEKNISRGQTPFHF